MKKQQPIKVIKANAPTLTVSPPADDALEKKPDCERKLTNTVQDWITERRETSLTEERSSASQLKRWTRLNLKPKKKSNKS